MLESIGKPSSCVPFMMPQAAGGNARRPSRSPEQIGSGPFKFVQAEFQPRREGGLRKEYRLRAAQGAAELDLRAARWSRSIASNG